MSDLDLDAIEARAKYATIGPWEESLRSVWHVGPIASIPVVDADLDGARTMEDAEFIAHAREDVPALVAEVRRLRALLRDVDRQVV